MQRIPQDLPAVLTDSVVSALGCRIDLMIQLELRFGHQLDATRLARALDLLLDAEPVLGCRLVEVDGPPHWVRLAPAERQCLQQVEGQAGYDAFVERSADTHRGPQVTAGLWSAEDGDRVALKVAHEAADAGGVKHLTARLSAIYERLRTDPAYRPEPNLDGARDPGQVLRLVPWRERPGIWLRYLLELGRFSSPWRSLRPPIEAGPPRGLRFHRRDLAPSLVQPLAAWGRARGATLNDLFLAAFFRALVAVAGWDGRTPLRASMTHDLRRHLPQRRAGGICNLSAIEFLRLPLPLGDDLAGTLERVVSVTRRSKAHWGGLNAYVGLFPAARVLSHAGLKRLVAAFLDRSVRGRHFPPGLTNMGPLDPAALVFEAPPDHARLLVPPIHPPGLGVGLSGYRGGLSLSAGIYPSTGGDRVAEGLFEAMIGEFARVV